MPVPAVVRAAFTALVLVVVAACSGAGGDATGRSGSGATPSPTSTPATTPAYDAGPWTTLPGALGRCGPQSPGLQRQHFVSTSVRGPHGLRMPGVTVGHGRTVAVLLHQTDGNGFCGWLGYAQRIANVPGLMALAFDLCGYGRSDCPEGSTALARQVDQVALAIEYAEHRLGARRIVLVGASMGGSLAVHAAARDPRVAATVDLSGPDEWGGGSVQHRAAALRVPVLIAMAANEGPDAVAAARATAEAGPPGSQFVGADAGHGYALLQGADGRPTALADRVLAWIRGS